MGLLENLVAGSGFATAQACLVSYHSCSVKVGAVASEAAGLLLPKCIKCTDGT
jgi:hypothetical protein